MLLPTQLGHTLPDSVHLHRISSARHIHTVTSACIMSLALYRWKPLAPNDCAEGRFIFINLLVSLRI